MFVTRSLLIIFCHLSFFIILFLSSQKYHLFWLLFEYINDVLYCLLGQVGGAMLFMGSVTGDITVTDIRTMTLFFLLFFLKSTTFVDHIS